MPRLTSPTTSRPEYFDRSPAVRTGQSTDAVVENTGVTQGWTYTVPTDNKLFVTLLQLIHTVTEAFTSTTATDLILSLVEYTPNGAAASNLILNEQQSETVLQGAERSIEAYGAMVLLAGDAIQSRFRAEGDAAGAGRVRITQTMMAIEFDA